MLPLLAFNLVACGDDDDDPEVGESGSNSTANVLTINGDKWSDPKITVFDESGGNYYFTYMAFDYNKGSRNFDFHADCEYFEEVGEDIAEEIEIDKIGDIGSIALYDLDTEYISGKVIVEKISDTLIRLNFKNYQCYYYPESAYPSSENKYTINGNVTFTLDGE